MPTLDDAFDTFTRDAIRIEVLPTYRVDEESAAVTSAREGRSPDLAFLNEWHAYLDETTASGRTSRRLRLVSAPLTAYERFEIEWAYVSNAEHGEQIRLLSRAEAPDMKDYWIFDDDAVHEMLYDDTGAFLGSRSSDSSEAARVVEWVKRAWLIGTDLTTFSPQP